MSEGQTQVAEPKPVEEVEYNRLESQTKRDPVFVSYEEDIKKFWKTEEERDRVRQLVKDAEEQSVNRRVRIERKVEPFRKWLHGWKVKIKYGIHKKPFYTFRLARNYTMAAIYRVVNHFFKLNKYVLRGIEYHVTHACNFACTHCLCARLDERSTRKEMDLADYKRVTIEAMGMGATTFGIEGGEPLFKKGWEDILMQLQPKKNHIIISSNGYLFDEKTIKRCADIGVDTINFSLDSGFSELHDLFRRKKGSYAKVMKCLEWSRKHGIKNIINTTLHKGNLYTDGFFELLEFCETNQFMINILYAKGVGEFRDKNCMLDLEDINNFRKIIKPYAYAHIHHTAGGEGLDDSVNYNYGKGGCPGTSEMVNLTPYGDSINCANMHIYFGNIKENSLEEIRHKTLNESPFGLPQDCFLALDDDFMNVYYPMMDKKSHISLDEFNHALRNYEKKEGKIVYPDAYSNKAYNKKHNLIGNDHLKK